MSNVSFVDLLNGMNKKADEEAGTVANTTTVEATVEPVVETAETSTEEPVVETPIEEPVAEPEAKEASTIISALQPELIAYAEKVASVIDDEHNRELFGSSLDAVVLMKMGGFMKKEFGNDAHSLVKMANELYKNVRDL